MKTFFDFTEQVIRIMKTGSCDLSNLFLLHPIDVRDLNSKYFTLWGEKSKVLGSLIKLYNIETVKQFLENPLDEGKHATIFLTESFSYDRIEKEFRDRFPKNVNQPRYEPTKNESGRLAEYSGLRKSSPCPIPTFIGYLTSLVRLDISKSQVTGRIPTEIGELTNLDTLVMHDCSLVGSIPTELGLLKLLELNLNKNNLSGPLPKEINWGALMYLELSSNSLTGPLPQGIISENMSLLDLSNNSFSGRIPSGRFADESYLINLSHNQLTGSIPREFWICVVDGDLDLSHNQLTGQLPTHTLEGFYVVENLNLSHNHLSGPFPTIDWDVDGKIDLRFNNFSGSLPSGNQGHILVDENSKNPSIETEEDCICLKQGNPV